MIKFGTSLSPALLHALLPGFCPDSPQLWINVWEIFDLNLSKNYFLSKTQVETWKSHWMSLSARRILYASINTTLIHIDAEVLGSFMALKLLRILAVFESKRLFAHSYIQNLVHVLSTQ